MMCQRSSRTVTSPSLFVAGAGGAGETAGQAGMGNAGGNGGNSGEPTDQGGCACSLPGSSSQTSGGLSLVALGLVCALVHVSNALQRVEKTILHCIEPHSACARGRLISCKTLSGISSQCFYIVEDDAQRAWVTVLHPIKRGRIHAGIRSPSCRTSSQAHGARRSLTFLRGGACWIAFSIV